MNNIQYYKEKLAAIQWITNAQQFNVHQHVQIGDAIAAFYDCIEELAEKDALLVAKDNELCRALSEVKPLKLAIKQFKVWGTDGCRGKDDTCQGRLTLFIKSDKCLDCEYKTQGGNFIE